MQRPKRLFCLVAILGLLTAPAALAQRGSGSGSGSGSGAGSGPPALDKDAVAILARQYTGAREWGLKALVLCALGPRWHPDGAELILDGLIGPDVRLKAFALEALRGCDAGWLKPVATRAVLEEVVRLLRHDNALLRKRATLVLRRIAPFVDGENAETLEDWWRRTAASYKRTPAPGALEVKGSFEVDYRKRKLARVRSAVALNKAGLDLVIVLDSSASMRRTVVGARRAVRDVVGLVRGLVPNFRLGLIHYKDHDTLAGAAVRVAALTEDVGKVERALGKLDNLGGGDRLEAVDVGIVRAMEKETGWRRTAAKAIVLIGDAPPRANTMEPMFNLIRNARFGTPERGKWTFSAIDVSQAKDTARVFERIATLGGGVYHRLKWSDERSTSALESPLTRLLVTTALGAAGHDAAERLLRIYREYAAAGLFKRP